MKMIVIVVAALVHVTTAHAQALNIGALGDTKNVATVSTGAENGLVVRAGYARVAAISEHPIVVGGDLTLGAAEMDPHDFSMRLSALAPLLAHGRWNVSGGLDAALRGTHTDINQMIDVGAGMTLLAGYYAPRWFAAAEVGFEWAAATHIAASDAYRMLVYADARDGWYGNTGGLFRFGVQGGVTFGGNDVVLRAGQERDIAGKPAMFPIYATLGYARRW